MYLVTCRGGGLNQVYRGVPQRVGVRWFERQFLFVCDCLHREYETPLQKLAWGQRVLARCMPGTPCRPRGYQAHKMHAICKRSTFCSENLSTSVKTHALLMVFLGLASVHTSVGICAIRAQTWARVRDAQSGCIHRSPLSTSIHFRVVEWKPFSQLRCTGGT